MPFERPAPFAWNFCPTCGGELASAIDGLTPAPHCAACKRFFYRNPVPAACCFVTDDAGRLLLVQRAVEPCLGEWSLPGGYVELDESAEEAARRELEEETGLRARGMRILETRTQGSPAYGGIMLIGVVVERWEGRLEAASDALELAFFGRAERPPLCFSLHRQLLEVFEGKDTT